MKKFLTILAIITIAGTTVSHAALAAFSEDFEGLNQASGTALSDAGWLYFANVFDSSSNYLYSYGTGPAPNGTQAFSNVTSLTTVPPGLPPVGAQGLVVFSDYNNSGDHGAGNNIESLVFQEQIIDSVDVGLTYRFSFIAANDNLVAPSTALAFVKTIDPSAGYATTNFLTIDTTTLPAGNNPLSIDITIIPALDGQLLQFGFSNTATSFTPSGVNYDNVSFNVIPEPSSLILLALAPLALLSRRRIA